MKIIRYYKGSVRFYLRSGCFEDLLNAVKKTNLRIWDIQKKNGVFYGTTEVKRYKELARLARSVGVLLQVKKRNGFPFLVHRYQKRIGLLIGAAFFLCFLLVMQNFIWEIEVSGNQTLTTEQILITAKEIGLHRGTGLFGTDLKTMQKTLEYRLPGVAWLTLNRTGSKVVIELHESEQKPDIADEEYPCNLVAKKDGVIKYMEVYEGEKMVKINDVVCKGDILVSGVTEDKFQQTRLLHADGEIIAETYTKETFSQPLEIEEKIYTGKNESRKYLDLFGFQIPLFFAFPLDGDFEKTQISEPLILFGKELPIGLETLELKEFQVLKKTYTLAEAEALLNQKIAEYEECTLKNAKIISKETEKEESNGAFVIKVSYICEENIAQKEEIMINE